MPRELRTSDPGFARAFADLLSRRRASDVEVEPEVAAILADVRARGDTALIELSRKFDLVELTPETFRIEAQAIEAAAVDPPTARALRLAAERIDAFHRRQMPADERFTDALGVELGWRWTPLDSVGIYVPGGKAAYPSSVLMSAIPAKVAGVGRIVMAMPTPRGEINPSVLAAAAMAGVDEIYRIGGAQAIAALAFGSESIAPVAKIVGPGSAYIAAAKRQVFGTVGIDTIAGPSEVLVLADRDNDPDWIASDLLAQAEHDERAQATLITDDAEFAAAVAQAARAALARMARGAIAAESWRRFGALITVAGFDEAIALIDRIAPEHVLLAVAEADALLPRIRNAGAVFLGRWTPEAVGDYVAGPNHVLPTGGAARFSSGLSVLDFLKRTSLIRCDAQALARLGPAAMKLAETEGLEGHARSVALRLNSLPE
jgi:histidinol dehydrogenase